MAALRWIIVLLMLTCFQSKAQSTEERVAFIIGNASYFGSAKLVNPINDANAVAKALETKGFQIHRINDLRSSQVDGLRKSIEQRINKNSVLFIYYAGHGVQVEGRNYLLPTDGKTIDDSLLNEALYLGDLLAIIEKKRPKISVVILDACRDNPFRDSKNAALKAGLARVDPPSSTVVFYATRPGGVASDGADGNGLFTKALLNEINRPQQPLEVVFRRTATAVFNQSQGEQEPWLEGVIRHEFIFENLAHTQLASNTNNSTLENSVPAVSQPTLENSSSDQKDTPELLDKQSSIAKISEQVKLKTTAESTLYACHEDKCLPYKQWAKSLSDERKLAEVKQLFSKNIKKGRVEICAFDLKTSKCVDDKLTLTTLNPLAFLQSERVIRSLEIGEASTTSSGGVSFSAKPNVFRGKSPIECNGSDGRIEFLNNRVDFNLSRNVCFGFLPVSAKMDFNVLLVDYKTREMLVKWDLFAFSFMMAGGGEGIAKLSF